MKRILLLLIILLSLISGQAFAQAKKSGQAVYPAFNWDKVPVYRMFGSDYRLLEDYERRFIASGSEFICIEKQHGRNLLGGAELGAKHEIGHFREVNPEMKSLFYFNAAYAYTFTNYTKGFEFGKVDEAVRPFILIDYETGELAHRDKVYCFDVLNPDFRQWWVETVAKAVEETGADGLFVDQMHAFTFRRPAADRQSAQEAQALMMQMAKEAIGEDKILLLNNAAHIPDLNVTGDAFMFEHYNADLLSKENIINDWQLMKQLSLAGKIAVWRVGVEYEAEGTELAGASRLDRLYDKAAEFEALSREHLNFYLAAFLIGAQENSYFQYGWGWGTTTGPLVDYPEFRTPLGAPKGDYVQESPWVFTREFEYASVRIDLDKREGVIEWDNEPVENPIPTSGPPVVKEELIRSGAFNTPAISFTNEYDAYKIYPHLKGLFFDALPFHEKATRVFSWYGVPEGTPPGQKLPAVVLVHGGGGTAFPEWIKKWNDNGYIAIAVALEGQVPGIKDSNAPLPGWPVHEFSGPYRQGFFDDVEAEALQDQWFYHAVADVILAHNLIRSFPEVDTAKIGITGISWGGILVNVIAGLDDRFAFSVPVYGCGYLHETPNYSDLLERLNPEAQRFYMKNWEPSIYVPHQKQPTLFVNGTNDCHFSMNSFTKTFHASTNEKYLRVEHNMAHGHSAGWNPSSIYDFAGYIVKEGNRPFHLTSHELSETGEVIFHYEGEIADARLYASVDTADWHCENYEWKEFPVIIDPAAKTIRGTLPWGTLWFFVNGTNANGILYSSPMQKLTTPFDKADAGVILREPLTAKDSVFFSFVPEVSVPDLPGNTGSTSFTTTFSPSGSTWHPQCVEEDVFLARMTHQINGSPLWDMRIGKGGQIYSLLGPYGEGIAPQYRSWDFNTARWADDVWQMVNVTTSLNNADAFTPPPGTYLGRPEVAGMKYFIHAAGVYMNDPIFLTQSLKPFYSPQMASWYNPENRSFSTMHWGQQAHIPSIHKAEVLHTTRYKDLGSGIKEVTYINTNIGEVTVNRHNIPWGGVRASSLPQCWLSKPDNTLERKYNIFGSDDSGSLSSIDLSGGYFIWSAEGDDENRPAFAIVFGKDRRLNELKQKYNMGATQLRWGDGSGNLVRNYSVFTLISSIDIPPGFSFFYRQYYISGTMKHVHETAIKLNETTDYDMLNIDPEQTPLTKIKQEDFDNAFTQDIKLFASPVENLIPLFLMQNTETGSTYISPDLHHNVNTSPFTNPYPPGDPKYDTYQDRIVYKPYDGKIKYLRLLGYGVKKEKISTNIRFALLDSLIQDTTKVILPPRFKNQIWIPLNPCFNCAWEDTDAEAGIIIYNDFDDNQYIPWANPISLSFTDKEDNPSPSPENQSLITGKVVRGTGVHANVRFQLPDYLDLSVNNTFKIKVFYEGSEPLPSLCNIRLILRNNGLGTTQYALTQNIKRANAWDEYIFDVSGAVGRDTYNQVWLFFSSPDNGGITAGQTFYVDELKGPPFTINHNLSVTFTVSDGIAPLENARVELNSIMKETGPDGGISFINLEPGDQYAYTISKTGYNSMNGAFNLTRDTVINMVLSMTSQVQNNNRKTTTLYPNPVNDRLHITSDDGMERIEVLDIYGNVLANYKIYASSHTVFTEKFSPGLYMLRIVYNDKSPEILRFMVVR